MVLTRQSSCRHRRNQSENILLDSTEGSTPRRKAPECKSFYDVGPHEGSTPRRKAQSSFGVGPLEGSTPRSQKSAESAGCSSKFVEACLASLKVRETRR